MRKLIFSIIIFTVILLPVFSEASSDNSANGELSFGLQSSIFKYVLTSSNAILNTATGVPTNFAELNNYPLMPGDIFTLVINYGANSERSADYITTYTIQLQPDYSMIIPFIGKTDAKGKSIAQLRESIAKQISSMMPVQYVSFNLTSPATFSVFIYGGVNISGYINATPVTTVIDAIAACQGFKDNASYRDVRIIRGDQTISVDISDFYKNADFSANPRLLPGDKLYVPMAANVTTVSGMVQYPGKYELLQDESLDTLLKLSGALKPGANVNRIEIKRINTGGKTIHLKTTLADAASFSLENGDVVYVPSLSENAESITIEGAVYGSVISGTSAFSAPVESVKLEIPYYSGIDLLDVLDNVGGPTPYALLDKAEIRRGASSDGTGAEQNISVEIEKLWKTRESSYNIELLPGDHILIPVERTVVAVFGEVNGSNAAIPHVNGYTVMDYLALAGGINYKTANLNDIEIIDSTGTRTKVELTDEVPPGSVIYVNKNLLQSSNDVFNNIFIVTGWATVIITLINLVFDTIAAAVDSGLF